MKSKYIILLIIIIIAIIVMAMNWKKWFGTVQLIPSNGTPCVIGRNGDLVQEIPGTIQNGICVANPVAVEGYKYDQVEKKCFRIYADGQTWVSDEECKSRGLI